jgi:hypothetical protein
MEEDEDVIVIQLKLRFYCLREESEENNENSSVKRTEHPNSRKRMITNIYHENRLLFASG